MSIRRRPIKVATVSHRPAYGINTEENKKLFLKESETLIQRASRMGADLIAFPECYPQLALAEPWHHAEPTECGTVDNARGWARRWKINLVWPRFEYDPSRGVRNTAILIGRDGEIIGRHDKMFPTIGEIEKGVMPGGAAPVFETDFGRVGMLICFDMNFPEVKAELAKGKPDLVVFSSMYRGGLQCQALAYELGAFVVSAISAELGQVIDRCGRVIKESTYETLAVSPINTNSVAMHMDANWTKMDRMLEKYGPSLTFDYHTREAFYVVESTGEADISELVSEFQLEPSVQYFDRSRKTRTAYLAKFDAKKS